MAKALHTVFTQADSTQQFLMKCGSVMRPHWLATSVLCVLALSGCETISPSAKPACSSAELSAAESATVQSLRRQLGEKEQLITKLQSRASTSAESTEDPSAIQALRQKLSEKEEHITKLQSRLNALKLIEQDRQKRQTFRQRRATITPPK
ncbi:MAG: hypothetical protein OEY28_07675 [Nitrospira sp.]|nr:hypothetical protein [Nitrospira sp.]